MFIGQRRWFSRLDRCCQYLSVKRHWLRFVSMFPIDSFVHCWANETDVFVNTPDMAPTSFVSHSDESLHIPLDKEVAWFGQVRRIFMVQLESILGALSFMAFPSRNSQKKMISNYQHKFKWDNFLSTFLLMKMLSFDGRQYVYLSFHLNPEKTSDLQLFT